MSECEHYSRDSSRGGICESLFLSNGCRPLASAVVAPLPDSQPIPLPRCLLVNECRLRQALQPTRRRLLEITRCARFYDWILLPLLAHFDMYLLLQITANGIEAYGSNPITGFPKSGVFVRGCALSCTENAVLPGLFAMRLGDPGWTELTLCATFLVNQTNSTLGYNGTYNIDLDYDVQLDGIPACETSPSTLPKEVEVTGFVTTAYADFNCPNTSAVPPLLLQPFANSTEVSALLSFEPVGCAPNTTAAATVPASQCLYRPFLGMSLCTPKSALMRAAGQ
jgi:hypothetical protein